MIGCPDYSDYSIRQGSISDEDWLYKLYCSAMREYVEQTWGWDDEFQRNGFQTNLHPTNFQIIDVNDDDVGAYIIIEEDDHYWLEMLLISGRMQGKWLGTAIINKIQAEAEESGKPLKLSVLKVNPAKGFYSHLGFYVYAQDESSLKMKWAHNKPI